jgi:hypothetical protein
MSGLVRRTEEHFPSDMTSCPVIGASIVLREVEYSDSLPSRPSEIKPCDFQVAV